MNRYVIATRYRGEIRTNRFMVNAKSEKEAKIMVKKWISKGEIITSVHETKNSVFVGK